MTGWIDGFDGFLTALGPALQAVFTVTWQASVLVLIVLAAHTAFGRWLSPRWRYALWSVVVLRLMLPVTPGSAVSVFNLFRGEAEPVVVTALPTAPITAPTDMDAMDLSGWEPVASAAGVKAHEPVSYWDMADVLFMAWLIGAALVLGVLLLINVILALRLRRGVVLNDPGVLALVESCKREMGVRRTVRLIVDRKITSPALAGMFRPTLLIPPGLLDDLPREELRFILLHELAHVKKHDIAVNWLLIALSAAHWFNPLIWFAFSRLRADRELARDAMVLRAAGAEASQAYGQTIIRILERLTHPRLNNPALAGIGDGMGQLKRRLRMIALSPKRRPALTVVGMVLLATLAAIGLTDAAERGMDVDPATTDEHETNLTGAEESAAEIVRQARAGEEWIHQVDSFYARFEAGWGRSTTGPVNERPGMSDRLPIAELNSDPFRGLQSNQRESLLLAFDDSRFAYEWLQPGHRHTHRVWDGVLKTAYVHSLETGDETYYLDDIPRNIGRYFKVHLSWLRGTPHNFRWDEYPPGLWDTFYGLSEDWELTGRIPFLGIDCYVLERRFHKVYIGVDDHRVHGFAQFTLASSEELDEARRRLAETLGASDTSNQGIIDWQQSLTTEQRRSYDEARYDRLKPFARLQALHKVMDYQEVAPGCWFPMRQGYLIYKADDPEGSLVIARRELRAVEVKVNEPLDDDLFTMEMKEGVKVIDRRHEPEPEYERKEGTLDIENGLPDAAERGTAPEMVEHQPTVVSEEDVLGQTDDEHKRISLSFDQISLEQAINEIRDKLESPLFMNWEVLQRTGVDRTEKINMAIGAGSVEQALLILLKSASDGKGLDAPAIETVDGVLTVSTRRDLRVPSDVRVYDIRDLLGNLGVSSVPTFDKIDGDTLPDAKQSDDPIRADAISRIMDLIRGSVGYYDDWEANGGDYASVRELNSNLVIKTAPDGHRKVARLLAGLRKGATYHISFGGRILTVPERFFEEAGLGRSIVHIGDDARVSFLDDPQVQQMVSAARQDDAATTMAVPLITQAQGREASVTIEQQTAYVEDYTRIAEGDGATYEPVVKVIAEGVTLKTLGSLTDNRHSVTATLETIVTNVAHPIEKVRWADSPPGEDLFIDKPDVTKAQNKMTVTVPDKGTVLIDVGMVSGPMDRGVVVGDADAVEEGVERRVYVLVKPTILMVPEANGGEE